MKTKDLAYMALMLALLVVCSKISITIGPIPVTFQTFAVIMMGFILKTKKSLMVFAVWLLIGLLGLPVFSQGGGFAYVFQPSFGFMIGFLVSSLVTGMKGFETYKGTIFKGLMGLLIIDVFGLVYMYFILKFYMGKDIGILYVLEAGLLPFVIKDIISVGIAGIAYRRVCLSIPHPAESLL